MKTVGILLLIFSIALPTWARVRRVAVLDDQVVVIKTAIGIATIIQVPDRPNSIVVGDQNAFKVEYLDQAITIKPIIPSAKSNLYIYTDYRRFNVQLVTSSEASADYVVYLENPKEKQHKSPESWMEFKNYLSNDSLTLSTKRLAKTKDEFILVEFDVTSQKRERLLADWIWLTQNGVTRPIHNLVLSGQDLAPDKSIQGVMQISRTDIAETSPMRIELRRSKTSYLTIPKVTSWKSSKK